MIEVRIRPETEAKSRHLCTWPVTDLDSLIPTLISWGLQDRNNEFMGQFVIDDSSAFFEVVVTE